MSGEQQQLALGLTIGRPARGADALVTRDDGTPLDPGTDAQWADWVSAGATRNWCKRNELIDWLDLYGIERGFTPDAMRAGYDERLDFGRWVSEQGQRFEEAVLAHLGTQVAVTRIAGDRTDARSLRAAQDTWRAMERGDSAIAQGVLRDPQARMYGKVDLIVRSDLLERMCADAFGEGDDPAAPAPALGAPWHYRIVDVKFTTLSLLKDGGLSTATDLATCAQVWAYNAALGRLQGYAPPYAYVVGRAWKQGQERGDVCWERLGRVARDAFQKGRDMTLGDAVAEAAAWVRRVRAEGASWNVLPQPSVPELWPNMRESEDGQWHKAKVEIARELGEITLLRTVNVGHRRTAHDAGITRWDDARVSAASLGLTGPREAEILDAILAVHRDGGPAIRPERVGADEGRWRERQALELYVDFETVNDLDDDFSTFPRRGGTPLIFQIGCGRFDGGVWTFEQFTARDLSIAAEGEMIDEWITHLERLARDAGLGSASDARLFHWSAAETVMLDAAYNSARERHPERSWPDLGWYDILRNVVQAEPVVIRGSMGFGLKAVARAFHQHGLISTEWGDGLADGTGAMAGAWLSAGEARRSGTRLTDVPLMREIDRYNEIDCRVMAEVLDHLRREH